MHTFITRDRFTYAAKVIMLGLILGLGIQFAWSWKPPTEAPPGGNVTAPITATLATNEAQTRASALGIMAPLTVWNVGGQDNYIATPKICINNNNSGTENCIGAWDEVSGGGTSVINRDMNAFAWFTWSDTAGIIASKNISGITKNGNLRNVSFSSPAASSNYAVVCNGSINVLGAAEVTTYSYSKTTGGFVVEGTIPSGNDPINYLDCVVVDNSADALAWFTWSDNRNITPQN